MPFSFFGLVVNPGKVYTQTVTRPFRVTMATYGEKLADGDRCCVKVEVDGETYVLCALSAGKVEQQTLDVVFEAGEEISFSTSGKSIVYLTGNYLPEGQFGESDDETDSEAYDSELGSEEEIGAEDLERLRALIGEDVSSEDEEDEQDVSDGNEDFNNSEDKVKDVKDEISDKEKDDEKNDESDEESDEAMESAGEQQEPGIVAVQTAGKRKAEERPSPQSEKKLKDNDAVAVPVPSPKTPAKAAESTDVTATDASVADAGLAAARKANKTPETKAAERKAPHTAPAKTAAATPENQGNESLVKPQIGQKKSKAQKRAEKRAAARAASGDKKDVEQENKNTERKLDNGLIIQDTKVGNGATAVKGKKVSVRYVGKLVKGGKVFDKNVSGKPFSFLLGRGEVIKGWDLGVENMKAGGERRLIIPAPLAYGAKGAPPDIPKNATLEFEVKLVEVK